MCLRGAQITPTIHPKFVDDASVTRPPCAHHALTMRSPCISHPTTSNSFKQIDAVVPILNVLYRLTVTILKIEFTIRPLSYLSLSYLIDIQHRELCSANKIFLKSYALIIATFSIIFL